MMRGEPSKRTSLDLKQFIDKVPVCGASRLFSAFVEHCFGSVFHHGAVLHATLGTESYSNASTLRIARMATSFLATFVYRGKACQRVGERSGRHALSGLFSCLL